MNTKKHCLSILFILTTLFCSNKTFGQTKFANLDKDDMNFGLSLNLNYSLLGNQFGNYVGRGLGSFGPFISRPVTRFYLNRFLSMWDMSAEPAITLLSTREMQSDIRYTNYYFDANFGFYFIPDRSSNDLQLFFAFRPSYLLFCSNEVFELGNYKIVSELDKNKNRSGDIDLCTVLGVNVALSDVLNVEMKYVYSFTDKNTDSYVSGRPSSFEIGVKLSALSIRDKFSGPEISLRKYIKKLSKGTLLVMLPTPNENEIDALISKGLESEIDTMLYQNKTTNEMVIQEFKKEFDFCNVLFFMDSSVYKVMNKHYDNVFVNERFESLNEFSIDTNNLFVASFCADISAYTTRYDYGLYVYNTKMEQLGKPFNVFGNYLGVFTQGDPLNYIRKRKILFDNSAYKKVIKKLNNRLMKYKYLAE